MGRPKGSKNKPKLDFTVDAGLLDKPKRKRGRPKKSESEKAKSKKKKESKKNLPAVIKETPKAKKAKSKKRLEKRVKKAEKLTTVFGTDSKKIQRLLKKRDEDGAILLAQRSLLEMLIDLIPIAEENYRTYKNERSAYAINALISQSRELIQDIIASQDRALAADKIIYEILKPSFVNFAQFLIDQSFQTRREMESLVDAQKVREVRGILDKDMKAVGAYMNEFVNDLGSRIKETLGD